MPGFDPRLHHRRAAKPAGVLGEGFPLTASPTPAGTTYDRGQKLTYRVGRGVPGRFAATFAPNFSSPRLRSCI